MNTGFRQAALRLPTVELLREIGEKMAAKGRVDIDNRATKAPSLDAIIFKLASQWIAHHERGKRSRRGQSEE